MAPSFHVGSKPWKKVHDLSVWIVDGDKVRNDGDVAFTNAGEPHQFPKLIPPKELWISSDASKSERRFLLDYILRMYQAREAGQSPAKAEKEARQIEEKERARVEHAKEAKKGEKIPASALGKVIRRWPDGVVARWVNGRLVRDRFDDEYTEGGHDRVYGYVPARTIIIDDAGTDKADLPFILIHERREYNLMGKREGYDDAHHAANELEAYARAHPKQAEAILTRLGDPDADPMKAGSASGGRPI